MLLFCTQYIRARSHYLVVFFVFFWDWFCGNLWKFFSSFFWTKHTLEVKMIVQSFICEDIGLFWYSLKHRSSAYVRDIYIQCLHLFRSKQYVVQKQICCLSFVLISFWKCCFRRICQLWIYCMHLKYIFACQNYIWEIDVLNLFFALEDFEVAQTSRKSSPKISTDFHKISPKKILPNSVTALIQKMNRNKSL